MLLGDFALLFGVSRFGDSLPRMGGGAGSFLSLNVTLELRFASEELWDEALREVLREALREELREV